jgi:hypothetical protein
VACPDELALRARAHGGRADGDVGPLPRRAERAVGRRLDRPIFGLAAVGSTFAAAAQADTVGPITFEPPTYVVGTINAQNGWLKTAAMTPP